MTRPHPVPVPSPRREVEDGPATNFIQHVNRQLLNRIVEQWNKSTMDDRNGAVMYTSTMIKYQEAIEQVSSDEITNGSIFSYNKVSAPTLGQDSSGDGGSYELQFIEKKEVESVADDVEKCKL